MFSRKDLLKLIIPLIIEQMLALTIGMLDVIMVSSVGEAAVSGISLVDSVNVMLINIFAALSTGGAVVAAQFLGRKDNINASIAAKQLLLSVTILSTIIMAVALLFNKSIINTVFGNLDNNVFKNAVIYFYITAISYPFLGIYNSCAALFRSMNNSRITMTTSFIMNVIHVVANAVLIFVFHMGVAGAAISTLATRAVGAVIMLVLLRKPTNPITVTKLLKPEFNFGMIKNILKIGVPSGLEGGIFQIGKVLLQSLVATFGTAGIAANAVAGSIASIAMLPASAIGLAIIPVVGQCVGAKDFDQAKQYTVKLIKVSIGALAVLNIFIILFSTHLISFYNLSSETASLARQIVIYHSITCIVLWPLSFTLPIALRAASDVKFTMYVSILSMWAFRIALSYIFAINLHLGIIGVWMAMTADWVVRAIAFIARFLSGKWKNKQLI